MMGQVLGLMSEARQGFLTPLTRLSVRARGGATRLAVSVLDVRVRLCALSSMGFWTDAREKQKIVYCKRSRHFVENKGTLDEMSEKRS